MGQKILVVEDNELNLKLFCDLLRAHGYAAEPVRDGREAIERARAFVPDLVVMDIQMPHISGLELIEQLKADAELKQIPIMAVTAYAAKGDEERIRDAGAEGYVSKPISVMKFVAAVAALLEACEARRIESAEPIEAAGEQEATQGDETGQGEIGFGAALQAPSPPAAKPDSGDVGGSGVAADLTAEPPGDARMDEGGDDAPGSDWPPAGQAGQ